MAITGKKMTQVLHFLGCNHRKGYGKSTTALALELAMANSAITPHV
ncbi:hypothetical protein ACW2QC_13845 [Virgibacillus sp. FSP13]